MKNKKNLYFLVPAVLFVWGLIIYRLIDFTDTDEKISIVYQRSQFNPEKKPIEEFNPTFAYADPFLKELPRPDETTTPLLEEIASVPPLIIEEEYKPNVALKYKGFVTPTGKAKKVALLEVDGKEVFLEEGKAYAEILLKKVFSDSVLFLMEDHEVTVKRVPANN